MKYAKEIETHEEAVAEAMALLNRQSELKEQIRSLASQLARVEGRLPSILARVEELGQ